tara:strand:- start:2206 stop:3159 length:954 start_codon:yes stop_codon:yes gene_type:complete
MKILVSVIVLTHNHESYISKALDSILSQKVNFNFEIIIGEDSSEDNTRNIVEKYQLKNSKIIKVLRSDKKLGMLKTEREAMKIANGKYIAFCEGDDFWHNKQKLQLQIDFLEDNSDYGLVHSDVNHLYETENKIIKNYNSTNSFSIPQGDIFLDLIDLNNNHGHLIKTMTACFRKDLFDKYWNYDLAIERNWQLTDLPIWLDLSKHCKVHYMSESLATYRLLSESASRSNNPKKLHAFHISVYEVRRHYAAKYNVSDKIIKNIEIHYHHMLLSDSYILRDSTMAKKAKSYLDKNQVSLSIKQKIKYYLTILPIQLNI